MTRTWPAWKRGFAGILAFCLPALVSVAGVNLDRSSLRHDPRYAAWVPVMIGGSVLVAVVVPTACIITTNLSLPRRIGLTAVMLCFLALECGLAFYLVLMTGLR